MRLIHPPEGHGVGAWSGRVYHGADGSATLAPTHGQHWAFEFSKWLAGGGFDAAAMDALGVPVGVVTHPITRRRVWLFRSGASPFQFEQMPALASLWFEYLAEVPERREWFNFWRAVSDSP